MAKKTKKFNLHNKSLNGMEMFCKSCGNVKDGVSFCPKCGSSISAATPPKKFLFVLGIVLGIISVVTETAIAAIATVKAMFLIMKNFL